MSIYSRIAIFPKIRNTISRMCVGRIICLRKPSFFDTDVIIKKNSYSGPIYLPDPTTKVTHFQRETAIEILLPFIKNLENGKNILLEVNNCNFSLG